MPPSPSGLLRRRLMVLTAGLLALTGCINPGAYSSVPALHGVKRAEVTGTWIGYDRARVVLKPDGKAEIRVLDGQEWDFDDRWRLSGPGHWKLTDKRTGWNDGQHVQVSLTSRTSVATRKPEPGKPSEPLPSREEIPRTYTWTFELRRSDSKALEIYFFFGDPDSRSTYSLRRVKP